MKNIVLLIALALCLSAVVANVVPNHGIYRQFLDFEAKFQKTYPSLEERHKRIAIFADNIKLVDKMNDEQNSTSFGVTKFMDLTPAEFKGMYLTARPSGVPRTAENVLSFTPKADPPASKDWRQVTDVITPVKNQEQCGSCWAFSATEAIESAWVLAGKSQVILGPQQIVDCDNNDGGCNGGDTPTAYEYVIKAGGQELEKNYPYTGEDVTCRFRSSDIAASITSWKFVSQSADDETTKMLSYVGTEGPVSVCVDAAPWQYYTGGVLKNCGMEVDHCVQVVGYDTEDGVDVWIVRNSWGTDWGVQQGYIWVERGKDLCSIAGEVTVAVV